MYFGIDHYYNDNYVENNTNNSEECLICLESIYEGGIFPIKLNSNIYYTKKCLCNGYIHKNCLDLWYSNNQQCPICRNTLAKHTYFTLILSNNKYILLLYLTIQNNITIIIEISHIIMSCFIYFVLVLYIILYLIFVSNQVIIK